MTGWLHLAAPLIVALSLAATPVPKTIRVALPAHPTPLDPGNHRSRITETILRRQSSGSPGDTDVLGCQQHAPLYDIEVLAQGP